MCPTTTTACFYRYAAGTPRVSYYKWDPEISAAPHPARWLFAPRARGTYRVGMFLFYFLFTFLGFYMSFRLIPWNYSDLSLFVSRPGSGDNGNWSASCPRIFFLLKHGLLNKWGLGEWLSYVSLEESYEHSFADNVNIPTACCLGKLW